jgi:hypothetical protein
METNEVYIEGVGTLNRNEWVVVMNADETLLLASLDDQNLPKIWVTAAEWEGRPTPEEAAMPTVKFEKEPSVKFSSMKEATDAFMKSKLKKQKEEKEQRETDMSTIPFEEIEKLTTDELLVLALMTQGEKLVRDKLYCALGHCQTGCKSCKKDD